LRGHKYGGGVSRGVSVYSSAFTGTKLYCLEAEAHRCEKLAQSFYATVPGRDSNARLLVTSPTLYRDVTTLTISRLINWRNKQPRFTHLQVEDAALGDEIQAVFSEVGTQTVCTGCHYWCLTDGSSLNLSESKCWPG